MPFKINALDVMIALSTLLSTALIAGMVAAFNPCGFAMLPAYLSYFLGQESENETSRAHNIFRGLKVGLTLAFGFMLFFGVIGLLTSTLISRGTIESRLGWVTLIFGILMIPLGVAMLFGYEPKLNLPRLNLGGQSRQLGSVFLFGVSFAVVSLGCTAPVFFATIVGSFTSRGIWDGTLLFVSYGAGMSMIVMALTIATAIARTEIAILMRRVLPFVGKISGLFLTLAGVFLIVYGWWEIQVNRGNINSNWLVDRSTDFQNAISNWISNVGETHIAIVIGLLLAGAIIWALWRSLDVLVRNAVFGVWLLLWLALEVFRYDWGLLILPLYNTIIDLPNRIGRWFTEPGRWMALFEVLFAVFIIGIAFLRARKRFKDGAAAGGEGAAANHSQKESMEKVSEAE